MKKYLWRPKLLLGVLCFLSQLLCVPSSYAISANSFTFKSFTADYYLERDDQGGSKMRVVEELVAYFPPANGDIHHGIVRVIPFTNQAGKNLTMASDRDLDIKVSRNGQTEPIDHIERGDGNFQVYIGEQTTPVRGEQTYRLEYEFENVIMNDSDNADQILYWDTNGNDWQQPFETVTARVHLDRSLATELLGKQFCYVGLYGDSSQNRCNISKEDNLITFSASNLSRGENLTFVLSFQPDTFVTTSTRLNPFFMLYLIFGVVVLLLTIYYVLKIMHDTQEKRVYYKSLFVKPEYSPLQNLSVAELGQNYLHQSKISDTKTATILELAVAKKIQIISSQEPGKKHSNDSWTIRILSLGLSPIQNDVLRMVAGSTATLAVGQEIKLEPREATRSLISLARAYNTKLEESLLAKGLLEQDGASAVQAPVSRSSTTTKLQPRKTKRINHFTSIALFSFIANIVTLIFLSDFLFTPYLFPSNFLPLQILAVALPILPLVVCVVVSVKYRPYYTHTELGLATSRYLDGLQLYIKMAEADRLKFLQSTTGAEMDKQGVVKLYEKLLPYAVLLGLEKTWLDVLSQYYMDDQIERPNWYIGPTLMNATAFSTAMQNFTSSAQLDLTHSTTSNSSSSSFSSSGGGFSGGGGGGGGGGGW